ncbi:LLM class flavin-dependent oxidoreductase [Escherichia coli]
MIGYLAANTTTLHLGSGGVMLPEPLTVGHRRTVRHANTLYPGRIDSGLGRAPGSDQRTMMALRRHMSGDIIISPAMWRSSWTGLTPRDPKSACARRTRRWRKIPVWLLGSSLYSAQLAAQLGLPFCVSPHTSRRNAVPGAASLSQQLQTVSTAGKTIRDGVHQYYRRRQQPRREFLFTSMQQAFVKLRRGEPGHCRRRFKISISLVTV